MKLPKSNDLRFWFARCAKLDAELVLWKLGKALGGLGKPAVSGPVVRRLVVVGVMGALCTFLNASANAFSRSPESSLSEISESMLLYDLSEEDC